MPLSRGILLAVGCAAGLAAQGAPGRAADAIAERAADVLRRSECQTSLPNGADARAPAPRAERAAEPRGDRTRARGGSARVPSGGLDLAGPLLWVGVGVAAVVLLAAILRQRGAAPPEPAAPRPVVGRSTRAAAAAEPALVDHERFAAAGDFAAAVHALLQCAVGAWVARGGAAPAHATARELVRRVRARSVPAEPLAALVLATELVHFGGRPADRALYERSREQLHRWEAACRPAP